ncbi:MAG: capsid cement protein [Rhodospirillaceae bacterium]
MPQKHSIHTATIQTTGAVAIYRAVGFDGAQASVAGQKVRGVATTIAAIGEHLAVDVVGSTIVQTGAAVAVGDSLVVDNQGRAVPAGVLGIAAGATPVTSTAADGAILTGADLPEFVFADALEAASAADQLIEVQLR